MQFSGLYRPQGRKESDTIERLSLQQPDGRWWRESPEVNQNEKNWRKYSERFRGPPQGGSGSQEAERLAFCYTGLLVKYTRVLPSNISVLKCTYHTAENKVTKDMVPSFKREGTSYNKTVPAKSPTQQTKPCSNHSSKKNVTSTWQNQEMQKKKKRQHHSTNTNWMELWKTMVSLGKCQ